MIFLCNIIYFIFLIILYFIVYTYSSLAAIIAACFINQSPTFMLILAASYIESALEL